MALRYVAILLRNNAPLTSDLEVRAYEAVLRYSIRLDRVVVFANAPLSHSGDFVFIGDVFRKSDFTYVSGPDITLLRTGFDWTTPLTEHYWGTYVAVTGRPGPAAFRDPSGQMPCLIAEKPEALYVASDLAALRALTLLPFHVSWSSLHAHLFASELCRPDTCLEGISELRPAELVQLGPTGDIQRFTAWQPPVAEISDGLMAYADRARALREIVLKTTQAIGSRHTSIILGVSGGLDSSVAASALGNHPGLKLMTKVAPMAAGDERPFARLLADHLGYPLEVIHYDLDDIGFLASHLQHLARPRPNLSGQAAETALRRHFGITGEDATFSGFGGDNVFGYLTSGAVLADLLLTRGLTGQPWRTLDDLARLTGDNYLAVARAALKILWRRKPRTWPTDPRGLTLSEALAREPFDHPWLSGSITLPGKYRHLELVARTQNRLEGFDRKTAGPTIAPLLLQPIVEHCLAVPVWEWCRGGENRSLVRAAFAEDLPLDILTRRTKGSPGGFSYKLFKTRQKDIREILLDGSLRKHGIIDVSAIEAELSDDAVTKGAFYHRLLEFTAAELWANSVGPSKK
ncbi:asparagine synthetase (plasmid) [Asticcacaulis excentricus]|uniref:asparagine synthase (glutamine-hydrolyzing) n=1 Tax=Asticcacaulis excentricus TaxID=78587 RepID=A0A3G9G5S3_9CAUL|nr:asparagine synthetase [Asticcacaulis excentricus]